MAAERRARPDPLAVLRSLGSEARVPEDVSARLEQRLAATLLIEEGVAPFAARADVAAASPQAAALPRKGALGSVWHSGAGKGAVLGLMLALGAGAHALLGKRPVQLVYVERPGPAASAAVVPSEKAPSVQAPIELAPPTPSAEPVAPRSAPALSRAESLKQERAQLDAVRKTLALGDANAALARLAEYDRKFSRPKLGEERDALRVNALVVAGKYDDARRAIANFRRVYPQSLLTPAIAGAESAMPSP